MSIKGYKSQQALQQKLSGYTEDQSVDKLRYTTIQEMSGRRHALDVLINGAYQITTTPKTIEAGSNIRTIKITNHGASKNDIIRLSNGTQFSALSIPDANTIITSVELDVSPVGDTCTIWRHITPSYNSDGSLNVIASQAPVKFNKDGTPTTVNYVTGAPSSSDALPVNIVTVNGQGIATTVDLSGAQINVQLTDRGTSPDAVRIGDGTNLAGVTASNEIKTSDASVLAAVNANGVVSTGNSSTATLGANAVFTGTAVEIKDYSAIAVAAISDVASATNGLSMQFSPDGTNWDHTHSYTSPAATGLSYTQACELRYFRIVYTNGAAAQTYFRLTVILKRNNTMPSRYTFDQGISGSQLADNTKSVIHGLTTGGGGGYVPVKVNPSGALTVDATISSTVLATGASTSALQTTGNTSLSSIDTKTPALGQALMAASVPVVIASNQSGIPVTGTMTVSGTVTTTNSTIIADGSTAAGLTSLIGAKASAGAATYTAGQQTSLQSDLNGYLKVTVPTNVTINALTNSSVVKAQLQDNAGTAIVLGQQAITASVPVALSSRHEAAATPVSMRQSDGTNFLSSIALAAAQLTSGALTAIRMSAAVAMGWDGATHREIAVDTSGQQKVVQQTSSGTITQINVTVGLTAVRATVAGTAPNAARKRLLISPLKTNTGAIYLGASTVTTANGMEIIGPDRMEFILDASDYYLISDTAGQAVRIVEVV